jgi:hypothetical protein
MPSSPTFLRLAPVRTDVPEERIASIIREKFVRELVQSLVTANAVPSTSILVTLLMEVIRSSETSILATATRRPIPEDDILHSHHRGNLKCYIALTG